MPNPTRDGISVLKEWSGVEIRTFEDVNFAGLDLVAANEPEFVWSYKGVGLDVSVY